MGQDFFQPLISPTLGRGLRASVNGDNLLYRPGGITIDWSTVTAVSADTKWNDGTIVLNGRKGLRYGQVLAMIGTAPVQTVTISGTPTGGTFTLTVPAASPFLPAETTPALAYNASAATVQAALQGLSRIGPGNVSVGLAGAVYTLTFDRSINLASLGALTAAASFSGGSSPSIAVAVSQAALANNGFWGPYDPGASDGRQTLAYGALCVLDESMLEASAIGVTTRATNYGSAIVGGDVYQAHLIAGLGTASLANGPTIANLITYLPNLRLV